MSIERKTLGIENRTIAILTGAALLAGAAACAGQESSVISRESNALVTDTTDVPTTDSVSPSPSEELIEALKVVDSSFDCLADNDDTAELIEVEEYEIIKPKLVSKLKVDASIRTQDNKLFSDAVANPLINLETAEAALLEFQNTLCESPEITAMAANYFANLEVEGVKVLDINEWLKGNEGPASVINDNAAEYVPHYFDESVPFEDQLNANSEHREMAENLAELLERFQNLGIVEATTTFNYHLTAGGLSTEIPEFAVNDAQYDGTFLKLQLTFKDGRCVKALMINVDDQRIAESDICIVSTPPDMPPMEITIPPTTPNTNPTTSIDVTTTIVDTSTTGPTTTVPPTTIPPTTARPEQPVPVSSEVISGPGAGGQPDNDNNPENNVTTSHVQEAPTTTANGQEAPTTTEAAGTITATTLGEVNER